MGKVNKVYSTYQINRSIKDEVKQIASHTYLVNDKNTVINNKKNFRCNCQWFNDNKSHLKYCHCVLAVLKFIDPDLFWKEIDKNGCNNTL